MVNVSFDLNREVYGSKLASKAKLTSVEVELTIPLTLSAIIDTSTAEEF